MCSAKSARHFMTATLATCLACGPASTSRSEEEQALPVDQVGETAGALASSTFPLYWYASINERSAPRNDVTSIAVAYGGVSKNGKYVFGKPSDWGPVKTYLDGAQRLGKKVIVDVKLGVEELSFETDHADPIKTGGPAAQRIIEFVKQFDGHPALEGWYTQDEPSLPFRSDALLSRNDVGYRQGYHKTRAAYRLIKEFAWGNSRKPVFVGFASSTEVHSGAFKDSTAYLFRYAYDVLLAHFYPFRDTNSEFDPDSMTWQFEKVRQTAIRARQIGKPYRITLQAFGKSPWRLPTSREFEFLTYGAVIAAYDMNALGFYSQYVLEDSSPARALPYSNSGSVWLNEIWDPTSGVLNEMRNALRHPVRGLSDQGPYGSDLEAGIRGQIFRDTASGDWFVVALNNTDRTVTSWFQPRNTDGKAPADGTFREVRVINQSGVYSLSADKQAVRLALKPWEAKVLRFVR
jgi:hypothetical protein